MFRVPSSGRLERIELSMSVPQTDVLPLNYSRHTIYVSQGHVRDILAVLGRFVETFELLVFWFGE